MEFSLKFGMIKYFEVLCEHLRVEIYDIKYVKL